MGFLRGGSPVNRFAWSRDEFQCRERLEWDFYYLDGRRLDQGQVREFQCRERLEWDFYVIAYSALDLYELSGNIVSVPRTA